MKRRLGILLGMAAVAALLAAPAAAKPLYDTPSHLMQKGVEQDPLLMGKPWEIGCDGWRREGEATYGSVCRIHLNQEGAHIYSGEGDLYIDRKGPYLWFWSFSYDIKERVPGCRSCAFNYKREFSPERAINIH